MAGPSDSYEPTPLPSTALPAAGSTARTPERAQVGSSSAIRVATSNQISVLLVDDEALVRRVLGARLAARGLIVAEAANGREALAALSVRRFDILITDLQMPEMDGLTLLQRVHEEYPLMRRIVITGYTTMENALDALKHGAVGFAPKPVDAKVLDELIDLATAELRLWMAQLSALRRMRTGKT